MEQQQKPKGWKNLNLLVVKSLTFSVLLVMIFEVVPTVGEFWYTAKTTRQEASEQAHQEALRLVQLAAQDHEQIINNVEQLLSVLVAVPEIQSEDPKICNPFLAKIQKQYPIYSNLGLINLEGNVICSALPFPTRTNLSDRLYFQKALLNRGFAVGEFQIGRITKKPTINFSHVVLNDQKQIKSVIYAAIDLSWLQKLANAAVLPAQASIMVLDHKGFILARYPDSEKWVGKIIPDQVILNAVQSHAKSKVIETPGSDKMDRMYVFRKLRTAPEAGGIYLTVGVPNFVFYSQIESLLNQSLSREAFVTFLEVLFAWAAGFLFLSQIKKIQKAAKRLKSGDLTARTGLKSGFSELAYLAHTFDDMATNLETRTKEAEAEAKRLSFLSESATLLCSTLDYRMALQNVVQKALAAMGDCCFIDLFAGEKVDRVAVAHLSPDKIFSFKKLMIAHPPEKSYLISTVTIASFAHSPLEPLDQKTFDELGLQSLMVIPISMRGQFIGAIIFVSTLAERRYTETDIIIAEDLAEYIALAIENSTLAQKGKGPDVTL